MIAGLPEIRLLSNEAVSKLAGLAPLAQDSGEHQGKLPILGGRSNVRAILFVFAGVVRRYDAYFAAFHQRLARQINPRKSFASLWHTSC